MNSFDTVSIGSALLDVIMKSTAFTPIPVLGKLMLCEIYGGKADVEEAALFSGGAGTNTAVGFSRLGYRSAIVARMGVDFAAQLVTDELTREKVSSDYIIQTKGEQTGISSILVASNGSRSAMTFRGAAEKLEHSHIPFGLLNDTRWIHLSAIHNPDLIREIFLFCMKTHISLSWNPSKGELEEIILRSGRVFEDACQVIFLNDQEYESVKSNIDVLQRMAKAIVITRGKSGGEVLEKGQRTAYQALSVATVCELGAGDAFACGFVGALLKGLDTQQAVTWGQKNSASVVGHLGAKKGLLLSSAFL